MRDALSPVEGLDTGQATSGWLAVAWAAAPSAPVDAAFDDRGGALVLPPPGEPLAVDDAIIGSSGPKYLIGLLLWRELGVA